MQRVNNRGAQRRPRAVPDHVREPRAGPWSDYVLRQIRDHRDRPQYPPREPAPPVVVSGHLASAHPVAVEQQLRLVLALLSRVEDGPQVQI